MSHEVIKTGDLVVIKDSPAWTSRFRREIIAPGILATVTKTENELIYVTFPETSGWGGFVYPFFYRDARVVTTRCPMS